MNKRCRATVLLIVVLALGAPARGAADGRGWERVRDYGAFVVHRHAATGRYATSVTGDRTFRSHDAAMDAGLDAAIEQQERELRQSLDEMNEWSRQMAELIEEMKAGAYGPYLAAWARYRESVVGPPPVGPGTPGEPERPRGGVNPDAYFDRFDTNYNGELDWGEIEEFQETVYEEFTYQHNDTVLSPAEFMRRGGGDCDDFATFSASFIEHHGYPGYVIGYDPATPAEEAGHAVAAVYIGSSTHRAGYVSLEAGRLRDASGAPAGSYRAGNYVVLDYWQIGVPISKQGPLDYVARPGDLIGARW
jgi:hypothetical protein